MRIRVVALTIALAVVPGVAGAQAAGDQPLTDWIDFGIRGTDLNGDAARYQRYRDLRDGLFLENIRLAAEPEGWTLVFRAEHVGYRDQRLTGTFVRPGRLHGWVQWDQIPMLMSNSTLTIFDGIGTDELRIDPATQGQYGDNSDLFLATARGFDLESRRHVFDSGVRLMPSEALTLNASVQVTNREGTIPFGGSFGHSTIAETAAPVNHRTTAVEADAEYALDSVLLRAGYTASLFDNRDATLLFDSPFRAVDASNGASTGRASLPPSNSHFGVNGLASVQLPQRSRVTAYVSVGFLKDAGDPIMPFTSNSLTEVEPFVRDTVDGEARTNAVNLTFTSRPTRAVSLTARYRWYEYDNRTPQFALRQYEAYDGRPSAITSQNCSDEDARCTVPFGVTRRTFEADVRLTPVTGAAAGIGYTRLEEARDHRIFASTSEDVVRVTFDSIGTQYVALRTKYEHSRKRTEDFDVGPLEHAHEQLGMRHFDLAARDRDRVTVLGTLMASNAVVVSASLAAGKDDYKESEFGLRDNTHRVYSLGLDAMPTDAVTLSGSYSFERYQALSRSRQASPGPQFDDPARNWATDALDKVHSFLLNADLMQIGGRVDVGFSYDFNRARAFYTYLTGPVPDRTLPEEVIVETTLPDPEQLPPTLSRLHRAVTDITYWATERFGIGVSHWFEDYDVEDFTLDVQSTPNLLRGNTLLLGYLYRPYRANTVWGRILYRF